MRPTPHEIACRPITTSATGKERRTFNRSSSCRQSTLPLSLTVQSNGSSERRWFVVACGPARSPVVVLRAGLMRAKCS